MDEDMSPASTDLCTACLGWMWGAKVEIVFGYEEEAHRCVDGGYIRRN